MIKLNSLPFLDGVIYGTDMDPDDFKEFADESSKEEFKWRNIGDGVDADYRAGLVRVDKVYIYTYELEQVQVKKSLVIMRGHETQSIYDIEDQTFESEYTR